MCRLNTPGYSFHDFYIRSHSPLKCHHVCLLHTDTEVKYVDFTRRLYSISLSGSNPRVANSLNGNMLYYIDDSVIRLVYVDTETPSVAHVLPFSINYCDPIFTHDLIIVCGHSDILAISVGSGEVQWTISANDSSVSLFAPPGGELYYTTHNSINRFNIHEGTILWSLTVDAYNCLFFVDLSIHTLCMGTVRRYNTNGVLIWSVSFGTVDQNHVRIIASSRNSYLVLDNEIVSVNYNGEIVWSLLISNCSASLAISEGNLIAASKEGMVYIISPRGTIIRSFRFCNGEVYVGSYRSFTVLSGRGSYLFAPSIFLTSVPISYLRPQLYDTGTHDFLFSRFTDELTVFMSTSSILANYSLSNIPEITRLPLRIDVSVQSYSMFTLNDYMSILFSQIRSMDVDVGDLLLLDRAGRVLSRYNNTELSKFVLYVDGNGDLNLFAQFNYSHFTLFQPNSIMTYPVPKQMGGFRAKLVAFCPNGTLIMGDSASPILHHFDVAAGYFTELHNFLDFSSSISSISVLADNKVVMSSHRFMASTSVVSMILDTNGMKTCALDVAIHPLFPSTDSRFVVSLESNSESADGSSLDRVIVRNLQCEVLLNIPNYFGLTTLAFLIGVDYNELTRLQWRSEEFSLPKSGSVQTPRFLRPERTSSLFNILSLTSAASDAKADSAVDYDLSSDFSPSHSHDFPSSLPIFILSGQQALYLFVEGELVYSARFFDALRYHKFDRSTGHLLLFDGLSDPRVLDITLIVQGYIDAVYQRLLDEESPSNYIFQNFRPFKSALQHLSDAYTTIIRQFTINRSWYYDEKGILDSNISLIESSSKMKQTLDEYNIWLSAMLYLEYALVLLSFVYVIIFSFRDYWFGRFLHDVF